MGFWTWNPNQSNQVREILAHATAEERRNFTALSGGAGLVLAIGFGIVVAPMFGMAVYTELKPFTPPQCLLVVTGTMLGLVLVIGILFGVRRTVRNVLTDFEWAKEQGITKESLKIDRWS
jgi:hypothetical protein